MPTVRELVEKGKPIFVRNLKAKERYRVTIPHREDGVANDIVIPPTPYPIDISSQVHEPKTLAGNRDLRTYLDKGILQILEPEDAQDELDEPDIKEAMRNIGDLVMAKRPEDINMASILHSKTPAEIAAGTTADTDDPNSMRSIMGDPVMAGAELTHMQEYLPGGYSNTKVMYIAQSVRIGDMKDEEALKELKLMALEQSDLFYIMQTVPGTQTAIWAQQKPAKDRARAERLEAKKQDREEARRREERDSKVKPQQ